MTDNIEIKKNLLPIVSKKASFKTNDSLSSNETIVTDDLISQLSSQHSESDSGSGDPTKSYTKATETFGDPNEPQHYYYPCKIKDRQLPKIEFHSDVTVFEEPAPSSHICTEDDHVSHKSCDSYSFDAYQKGVETEDGDWIDFGAVGDVIDDKDTYNYDVNPNNANSGDACTYGSQKTGHSSTEPSEQKCSQLTTLTQGDVIPRVVDTIAGDDRPWDEKSPAMLNLGFLTGITRDDTVNHDLTPGNSGNATELPRDEDQQLHHNASKQEEGYTTTTESEYQNKQLNGEYVPYRKDLDILGSIGDSIHDDDDPYCKGVEADDSWGNFGSVGDKIKDENEPYRKDTEGETQLDCATSYGDGIYDNSNPYCAGVEADEGWCNFGSVGDKIDDEDEPYQKDTEVDTQLDYPTSYGDSIYDDDDPYCTGVEADDGWGNFGSVGDKIDDEDQKNI